MGYIDKIEKNICFYEICKQLKNFVTLSGFIVLKQCSKRFDNFPIKIFSFLIGYWMLTRVECPFCIFLDFCTEYISNTLKTYLSFCKALIIVPDCLFDLLILLPIRQQEYKQSKNVKNHQEYNVLDCAVCLPFLGVRHFFSVFLCLTTSNCR